MKTDSLLIDTDVAERVLTQFIYNEVRKTGFTKIVLGVSGGIDSALSCFLAAKALNPENVLALRMPYRTSSPSSLEHAQLVIDALGVRSETIEITHAVDAFSAASSQITPHRLGNVMARVRMTFLYDRSADWDALVIGTSNKTELLLGYGTIFGDLASAINPIGDLYKTQVRQLALAFHIPDQLLDKAPTADLMPGQTDEGDLGFTYAEVDRLLYLLIDERFTPQEAIAQGFEQGLIDRVQSMIRHSHFKRSLPIIPKLSGRTIGHDFRYLRDAGS